jgi:thioredoxin-like negative regulator of GroEL
MAAGSILASPLAVEADNLVLSDVQADHLLREKGITILIFTADWCEGCKRYDRNWRYFARRSPHENFRIGSVNVGRFRSVSRRHAIQVVPTTIWFLGGREIERHEGILSVQAISEKTRIARRREK